MSSQAYDIIGDIHGHADELIKLLQELGYSHSDSGYQHPSRQVIFLGDFIDRGPQHKKLLDIVMPMVRNGHALAVMGNHEFNALAYHTFHEGEYLRPHTKKNKGQHQAFLNEFEQDDEQREAVLEFFYELPMWLELDGLRVVHACWDQAHIDLLQSKAPDSRMTPELLIEASTKGSAAYEAIERILKGVEVQLPEGITFQDKDGHSRNAVRVQWWNSSATRLAEATVPEGLAIGEASDMAIPDTVPRYPDSAPPCFIGHYWLNGQPAPLAHNVACLDYSVAKEGKLVAYRWNGESELKAEHFSYAR
ncbi:metallophosphoesterase [Parahaliea sp. F7430]|uniref:Metallophosphoesterase n=1 Tax=Sediminihaliea albiluteola TaxID=2758564 RepID=A0A7W2YJJ4_9GAMM|nr:metallophosphoesterase [Sediminihaliea albiluteola]MBA6412368.1 metallophosphoesterase [Sediminihaliea albiluteola]